MPFTGCRVTGFCEDAENDNVETRYEETLKLVYPWHILLVYILIFIIVFLSDLTIPARVQTVCLISWHFLYSLGTADLCT